MLRIRQVQMEVLAAHARRVFEDRLIRQLRRHYPQALNFPSFDTGPGDAPLRALVRSGIERARRYGVTSERDVARFVELLIRMGTDFDQRPSLRWARSMLEDSSLPAPARIELIHQQLDSRASASSTQRPR